MHVLTSDKQRDYKEAKTQAHTTVNTCTGLNSYTSSYTMINNIPVQAEREYYTNQNH